MELSNSAREIVVQAQMLMLSTGGSGLCVEHLFYGVLLLADYLDPPMDKPEFREDGKKVRAWLEEGGMQSVAAARKQLKTDAEDGGSNFENASAVLGRAAEIADGGEISAMDLARAVMETSTPTILALRGLRNPALAAADARYGGKLPVLEPDMVRDPAPVKREKKAAKGKSAEPEPVNPKAGERKPAEKAEPAEPKPAEPNAGEAKSAEPGRDSSHPDEETGRDAGGRAGAGPAASGGRAGAAGGAGNGGQNGEREGLTPSQLGALLAFMALAQSQQTDGLRQNMNQGAGQGRHAGGQKPPKVVRRTKMGPFTYRGGTVAAAIQYFLFGIIVPFVGLIALNFVIAKVTGGRSESATGLPMYLIYLYISLWLFYLARGVALLFGIYSSALGNFLDILCDFGLIAMNVRAVKLAWAMPAAPVWLRVVSCIIAFLVLNGGIVLFDHLRDEGDITKTRINMQNKTGTAGKIYFQSLAETCRLPLLIFAVLWITRWTPPALVVHILWILGFFWVWVNVFNAWFCLCVRCEKGHHRGLGLWQFLHAAHVWFTITNFVLFLHWHFHWFPMKRWVMIVLGIYSVLALLFSIVYSRIK